MSSLWKGKCRENAQEMNSEEQSPVITYRHLLSSGLGVRNPLRVCGLSDMDAFYAACEQIRLGLDPSIPLVVRQWDALIAVNYPARAYGISRMDKISSALQRCPHLRVVHVATFDPSVPDAKPTYTDNPNSETHKVSLDYYRKESKKIMDVFKEMLPGAEVGETVQGCQEILLFNGRLVCPERASIDEAFIDFTEPVRRHILAHFPHLATPPPEGLDCPLPPPPREGVSLTYPASRTDPLREDENIWSSLGTLVPISGKPLVPPNQEITESEAPEPVSKSHGKGLSETTDLNALTKSSNLLSFSGRFLSAELEDERNEHDRPLSDDEGSYTPFADTPDHLQSSDVTVDANLPPTWHDIALSIAASLMLKMRDEVKTRLRYTTSAGIARNKFLAKLVASYKKRDNQTILRNAAIPSYLRPLPFQKIRFLGGKLGAALAETYEAQTVGDLFKRSISLDEFQRNFGESSIWVWELLRGIDRSEVKEKPPIAKSMGASKNLQHPVTHPSEGAHWLHILAGELSFRLQEAREENPGLWPKTLVLHVRQAYGITRSKQAPFPFTRTITMDFISKAAEKLWVELVGTSTEYEKNRASGKVAAMKITNVFLGFTGVETMAVGQRSIEGFFSEADRPNKRKADEDAHLEEFKRGSAPGGGDTEFSANMEATSVTNPSFRCPRCGKHIRQPIIDGDDREVTLSALKMEHDDFHYAQDLAKSDYGGTGLVSNEKGNKKRQRGGGQAKGIAKFFSSKSSKK